jgi:hypothetical protein
MVLVGFDGHHMHHSTDGIGFGGLSLYRSYVLLCFGLFFDTVDVSTLLCLRCAMTVVVGIIVLQAGAEYLMSLKVSPATSIWVIHEP